VLKATWGDEEPPKPKHVKNLLESVQEAEKGPKVVSAIIRFIHHSRLTWKRQRPRDYNEFPSYSCHLWVLLVLAYVLHTHSGANYSKSFCMG
jgi:hypothetical protein